jgi:RimJ/RimL family protein N-acetyltransferase
MSTLRQAQGAEGAEGPAQGVEGAARGVDGAARGVDGAARGVDGAARGVDGAALGGVDVAIRPWPLAVALRLVGGSGLDPADGTSWHPDYPLPDTVDALQMLLTSHRAMGTLAGLPRWWVHEIWVAGQVVGDVGFHGPPPASGPVVVEIGYAVVPALRGRGIASRACALLLERAWQDGASQVLAETDADNVASQAVLRHNGFRRRLSGDFAVSRATTPVPG